MALKPWPKGVSGNPGGRKNKPMVDRMLEEILTANDSEKAKKIANKLISSALNGSLTAAKIIVERTEGKPSRNASETPQDAALTREQVNARLAELLSTPELRDSISKILFSQKQQLPDEKVQ